MMVGKRQIHVRAEEKGKGPHREKRTARGYSEDDERESRWWLEEDVRGFIRH